MKIIISLFAILATAFLTHHFFISKIDSNDRDLAAFSERNNANQIKWEHAVAEDLSKNKEGLQNSVKPNWQDQLAYEFFQGKYDISIDNGQIQKISLQSSADGVAFTAEVFLEKFGHQIKDYKTYKKSQIDNRTESISLYNEAGVQAGSFEIVRNVEGRVVEFIVR